MSYNGGEPYASDTFDPPAWPKEFRCRCGMLFPDIIAYQLHNCSLPAAVLIPTMPAPAPKDDKVAFSSGATSSGQAPPLRYVMPEFEAEIAYRFDAGNRKHEKGTNIFAEANWLKAFHARDTAFFQDRMHHARVHFDLEMRGRRDKDPGGNRGAIGWWLSVAAFVERWDPELYNAIVGLTQPPQQRAIPCHCPYCDVDKE